MVHLVGLGNKERILIILHSLFYSRRLLRSAPCYPISLFIYSLLVRYPKSGKYGNINIGIIIVTEALLKQWICLRIVVCEIRKWGGKSHQQLSDSRMDNLRAPNWPATCEELGRIRTVCQTSHGHVYIYPGQTHVRWCPETLSDII